MIKRVVYAVVIAGLLGGCATTSKQARIFLHQKNSFEYLPPAALLYIDVDIKNSRPLLDQILKNIKQDNKYTKLFLNKTYSVLAAYYNERPDMKFMGISRGKSYPQGAVNIALSSNKNWQKNIASNNLDYWSNKRNKISFALFNSRVFFSDGIPFLSENGTTEPEDFNNFKKDTAIALWFPDAMIIKNLLDMMDIPVNLPIDNFFASVEERAGGQWQIIFYFAASSPSYAKALASMFRIVRGQIKDLNIKDPLALKLITIMFTQMPQQNGNEVYLTGLPMDTSTLAGLITSAYSIMNKNSKK
ncbi:MAG: hypothetical protein Ta2F_13020 [Termitinemataceae bacterium]|nr:MAG: hypothetical protein Ta2F_13020 [Termitinemataceae bacterium]